MSKIAEGYIRMAQAIESREITGIDRLLDRLMADVLPVDTAAAQRENLPDTQDERGPYQPIRRTNVFGPIDVTAALAKATDRPLDVRPLPVGGAETEPTALTQASVTITKYKETRIRRPLPGVAQLDTIESHTIDVHDTSVEPPRLHARYESVPIEVNYPAITDLSEMQRGPAHVDELALAARRTEFVRIQAEQAARLSWLMLLDC